MLQCSIFFCENSRLLCNVINKSNSKSSSDSLFMMDMKILLTSVPHLLGVVGGDVAYLTVK